MSIFAVTAILAGTVIVLRLACWAYLGLCLQIGCDGEPEEPTR